MALEWTSDLAVGHNTIDAQHQELIRRFNTLLEACRSGQGKSKIAEVLDFLGTYVIEHFAAEEQLMIRHNYPEKDQHIAQHHYFIAELKGLQLSLQSEGSNTSVVVRTNKTLLDWILRHIKQVDVRLGSFLKD